MCECLPFMGLPAIVSDMLSPLEPVVNRIQPIDLALAQHIREKTCEFLLADPIDGLIMIDFRAKK